MTRSFWKNLKNRPELVESWFLHQWTDEELLHIVQWSTKATCAYLICYRFLKTFFLCVRSMPLPARRQAHTVTLSVRAGSTRREHTERECAVGQPQRRLPCSFSRTNLWFHQGYQKTRMIKYKWKETLLVQLSTVSRYKLQISLWGSCAKLKTLLFEATTCQVTWSCPLRCESGWQMNTTWLRACPGDNLPSVDEALDWNAGSTRKSR